MNEEEFYSYARNAATWIIGFAVGYLLMSWALDLAFTLESVKLELRARRVALTIYQNKLIVVKQPEKETPSWIRPKETPPEKGGVQVEHGSEATFS